jgi:hypothetical protein
MPAGVTAKLAIPVVVVVVVVVAVVVNVNHAGSNKCGVGANSIESRVRRGCTQHKQHDSHFDRGRTIGPNSQLESRHLRIHCSSITWTCRLVHAALNHQPWMGQQEY